MARRTLSLTIPTLDRRASDAAPDQPPAIYTTTTTTTTHASTMSSDSASSHKHAASHTHKPMQHTTSSSTSSGLAMRRGHTTASLSLSLPTPDVHNDEDTTEECFTPESLDALFEAATISNLTSPTVSDVSDVSDICDSAVATPTHTGAATATDDDVEMELEHRFLHIAPPLAPPPRRTAAAMPQRRAHTPTRATSGTQSPVFGRRRSASDPRVLERLLMASPPSPRLDRSRKRPHKPAALRHKQPASVLSFACTHQHHLS